MKLCKRPRLFLEKLEDRTCPVLTPLKLQGGSLMISGSPVGALAVTETSANVLQIQDSGTNLGHFTVTGNLTLNLTRHPSTIAINLNGNDFVGSIALNLGTGDPASNPVTISNGTVNGSVTIQAGSGVEDINLGLTPTEGPNQPLTVKGSVYVTGRPNTSPGGNSLFVNPGSVILGNLITTQIANLSIGQPGEALTTIAGSVVSSDTGSQIPQDVQIRGQVDGSVSVIGDNGGDTFDLTPASAGVGGIILGNLAVIEGAGLLNNQITLDVGSFVAGSATLAEGASGGSGTNLFTVAGTVGQSLAISMGNGANAVAFSGTVFGNMSVTGGTGTNDLGGGGLGGSFTGAVQGSLSIHLLGTNFFNFNGTGGATVGGKIAYASGNGNNTFEISTGGRIVTLNVTFGTGNDTFTIDSAADEADLTGFLDWGDNVFGNDTFNEPEGGAFVLDWVFRGVQ